jgi:hypothetical protein
VIGDDLGCRSAICSHFSRVDFDDRLLDKSTSRRPTARPSAEALSAALLEGGIAPAPSVMMPEGGALRRVCLRSARRVGRAGSCHARGAQQTSPARVSRAARTSSVAPQGAACSLFLRKSCEISL